MAEACQEQLPFIYLSKNSCPQKTCINGFRKNNFTHFSNLFLQVLAKCEQEGIGDSSFSIVDGSKKEANSSKGRTKNKKQYEKWHQSLLADITVLEQESDNELSKKN